MSGTLRCSAPEGADCRLVGGDDCRCEAWSLLRDEQGRPYHLSPDDSILDGVRHYMHDGGECQVELFTDDLADELGLADFEVARTPVVPAWQGEGYGWEPAWMGDDYGWEPAT